ncbi:MAG: chalcone isomerase family protein [Proteobacteria bacterium]|nr:chalcone isomerase family protein [Pseudomonadota bacterium]
MIRKMMILLMLLFLTSTSAWALEIGGVELPDTLKAGDSDLILNGAGLRKKFGMKIYAVGLYLKAKSGDGQAVMDGDAPMALQMRWRMKVPPKKIDETFYESLALSTGAPKASAYGPLTDFGSITKDVVSFMTWIAKRETTKTDSWIFIYVPGKGTEVHVHDGTTDELMGLIPGIDFKKVLFGVWLMEDPPVGKSLRDDLLGK